MVALPAVRGDLHRAEQRIHFGDAEGAAGTDRAVAGHGGGDQFELFVEPERGVVTRQIVGNVGDKFSAIDRAALDAVRKAFEIELGGQAFYLRAAADSTDPVLQDLFGRFAAMEEEHMQTLQRRYHARATDSGSAFRVELAAIFAGVPNRPSDPANLFRIAIGMEERAAAFFDSCAQGSVADAGTHQLYRELAAEEREHADLLRTEYARWHAGKPGLLRAGDELAS